LGPQFKIGHSYVTPYPDNDIDDAKEWFRQVVETEIAPLLRAYSEIQRSDMHCQVRIPV